MNHPRPALIELAARLGILPAYHAVGGELRETSDLTRERLILALGYDPSTESSAREALRDLGPVPVEEAAAPEPCPSPAELLGESRRVFGLWTNLYTLRGKHSVGLGDLGDLSDLAQRAGELGASFVGLNPLHAVRHRGAEISPYGPVSRLFRSANYLALDRVPELERCPAARDLLQRAARINDERRIDFDAVSDTKAEAIEALWCVFWEERDQRPSERHVDFDSYLAQGGRTLIDFATFRVLEEHFAAEGTPRDWRSWPMAYRDPRGADVARFRREHDLDVRREAWVQFELDRQLGEAAERGRAAGMELGLYQDLALGSAISGFDAWAWPELFVEGVSLGAPPDPFAPQGQNWGLPPLHPERLAQGQLAYWRGVVRAAFRHSGAVRIDHAMGLERQFWIPAGAPSSEGAYVRFPARALFGVVCAESRKAGALVVGEDLGTVPEGFRERLEGYGMLSSSVLLFEHDDEGVFRHPDELSSRAMATANTHDHVPLEGYLKARDLSIRHDVGELATQADLEQARAQRTQEMRSLIARLVESGCLELSQAGDDGALAAAAHAFLARSPAPLVGLSLDDLAGVAEPINVPGVGVDRFPSWSRRMELCLEEILSSERAQRLLAPLAERGRQPVQ